MNKKQMIQIVKDILRQKHEDFCYDNDTNLIDAGILDSLEIVEMILEIENILGIEIDLELITLENFVSLDAIAEMLLRLTVKDD